MSSSNWWVPASKILSDIILISLPFISKTFIRTFPDFVVVKEICVWEEAGFGEIFNSCSFKTELYNCLPVDEFVEAEVLQLLVIVTPADVLLQPPEAILTLTE